MYNSMIKLCLILLKFVVSGNFPETAWRKMNCCQAIHVILCVF